LQGWLAENHRLIAFDLPGHGQSSNAPDPTRSVDENLQAYGIQNLRVADRSIMPSVATGNTMAPCVVIGERASELLRAAHKLSGVEE
jgi:choline dehydrogenase